MFTVGSSTRVGGKLNRRDMLQAGFMSLGGLTLADLCRLQASTSSDKKDRAVIVLWVHGGPSHLETYDLKPDAPSDFRSIFKPIRTKVPGMDLCELLPKHAALADKLTILRSVAHDEADHGFGTRRFCSGYGKSLEGNGKCFYPAYECVANRALGVLQEGMPVSMNVGSFRASTPWRGSGYWGHQYEVPQTYVHPNNGLSQDVDFAGVRVTPAQFADRKALLNRFDQMRVAHDRTGNASAMDQFHRQACEILTSSKTAAAFDMTKEPQKLRDKYNACGFGQDLLLARRLVEAGVKLVNVYIHGQAYGTDSKAYNWDDHAVNWDMGVAMKLRLPWYDHIVSTLIEDLHDRGLDEKVLLVATGEFGRTPRLEKPASGVIGRDHWPSAMSILVAGGGKKRGNVIGETNSRGEHPKTRQYDPHDFLATIYHYLGIDYRAEYMDLNGRPVPLTRGEPIDELV